MRLRMRVVSFGCLIGLLACSKPEPKQEDTPKQVEPEKPPLTAMDIIRDVHDSIERNCGADMPTYNYKKIAELKIAKEDQKLAESLLAELGLMAQQCGEYDVPEKKPCTENTCGYCPVDWWMCVDFAKPCLEGDTASCWTMGQCGSKVHCEAECLEGCSEVSPAAKK